MFALQSVKKEIEKYVEEEIKELEFQEKWLLQHLEDTQKKLKNIQEKKEEALQSLAELNKEEEMA
ncbi:hypothetical protein JK635_08170 [Neobacillus sp. YIM B02564]|uniref:Uncharacterized protein n=1 Tax=Neobacillus paridis TaxID=2803862 RepID=A0ABS1TLP6_9BACI|nr:hypothetical protein [Neobacillus paridis]MBL4952187.1 hypothetical protein [Neobacillus paridis]